MPKLKKTLKEQPPKEFNPRSPAQVLEVLEKRGLRLDSSAKAELMKHKEDPFVSLLLRHRELSKLQSSFIKPFLALPTLPYVHCTFNQVSYSASEDAWEGIKSGRLSCKKPNLQQVPARSENGKLLRKLFVPRPGYTLIVADYSQIELRLMAHYSKDPVMVDAYTTGKDIHEETSKALNVDRFWGKTANFSIGYGCSKWKLASILNTTPEDASVFINNYWKKYRVLRSWRYRTVEQVRQKGGVTTLFGRWIPIENLNSSDFRERGAAERMAVSYLIQGSAADIIKLAMLKLPENGTAYRPILTVHDELVFETTDVSMVPEIKRIMETIVKLDVPLEVSIGSGPSWGEAKQ